jgi:signal transduction histidine kinase
MKAWPLMIPAALALALAGGGGGLARAEVANGGLAERVARVASPEVRRCEARLGELAAELAELPDLLPAPPASRYGFRSEMLSDPNQPQWVQIDLGRSWQIDRLVVVPVHIPAIGAAGKGYGFPLRFKIEVADDPDLTGAVTVVDQTAADVRNPERFPLVFRVAPVTGRYVRFTSTRHFPLDGGFIWALEELLVLSGNRWVGVGEEVAASSSLELFPNWAAQRINDGMSALGFPVTLEPSPSHGYLSTPTNSPDEEKWLRVDLGQEHAIDEVRLVPVESDTFEVLGERAFPRAWKIELAKDPGFSEVVWRDERGPSNVPGFPWKCAVVVGAQGARGRYLRFVSQKMWGMADRCGFGLAEIQAYAGGVNVALGKPVAASDPAGESAAAGWGPGFLVDGSSSRHRLVEWPEYLDQIERRGALERERDSVLAGLERKVRQTGLVLGYGGGGLGLLAATGVGWLLVRQRTLRRRAVAQLRDQIARDLHDDLGSNLGGIVLLSEMGSRHSVDGQAREDFAAIKEAAEEMAKSMQDIVWLIGRGNTGLRDLTTRLRQAALAILGDKELSVTVEPPEFRDRELSLLFRRHVFFAFKEALNNVRRHAAAAKVEVCITINPAHLAISIRDDGVGFAPAAAPATGHGLANLARRAARLKGTCRVASSPGRGTCVEFQAPLKS